MSWNHARQESSRDSQQLHISPFASNQSAQPIMVLDSCLASNKMNKSSPDSIIGCTSDQNPVLMSRDSSALMSVDDPTMQSYAEMQFAIKKEQAFACHHAIDMADVTKTHEEEVKASRKFFSFLPSLRW